MFVVDDDALLRRAKKGNLERLIRCALHRRYGALKHRAHPFDLALHDRLVEGLVLRPVARRAVGCEAGKIFRDEMEDRFELKPGRPRGSRGRRKSEGAISATEGGSRRAARGSHR